MHLACPHCSSLVQVDPTHGNHPLLCPLCRGTFVFSPLSPVEPPPLQLDRGHTARKRRPLSTVIVAVVALAVLGTAIGIWQFAASKQRSAPAAARPATKPAIDQTASHDPDKAQAADQKNEPRRPPKAIDRQEEPVASRTEHPVLNWSNFLKITGEGPGVRKSYDPMGGLRRVEAWQSPLTLTLAVEEGNGRFYVSFGSDLALAAFFACGWFTESEIEGLTNLYADYAASGDKREVPPLPIGRFTVGMARDRKAEAYRCFVFELITRPEKARVDDASAHESLDELVARACDQIEEFRKHEESSVDAGFLYERLIRALTRNGDLPQIDPVIQRLLAIPGASEVHLLQTRFLQAEALIRDGKLAAAAELRDVLTLNSFEGIELTGLLAVAHSRAGSDADVCSELARLISLAGKSERLSQLRQVTPRLSLLEPGQNAIEYRDDFVARKALQEALAVSIAFADDTREVEQILKAGFGMRISDVDGATLAKSARWVMDRDARPLAAALLVIAHERRRSLFERQAAIHAAQRLTLACLWRHDWETALKFRALFHSEFDYGPGSLEISAWSALAEQLAHEGERELAFALDDSAWYVLTAIPADERYDVMTALARAMAATSQATKVESLTASFGALPSPVEFRSAPVDHIKRALIECEVVAAKIKCRLPVDRELLDHLAQFAIESNDLGEPFATTLGLACGEANDTEAADLILRRLSDRRAAQFWIAFVEGASITRARSVTPSERLSAPSQSHGVPSRSPVTEGSSDPNDVPTKREANAQPPALNMPCSRSDIEAMVSQWALHLGLRKPPLTNSVGIDLVLVPPGRFVMGTPPTEVGRMAYEGPQHEVILTRAMLVGSCEVTQGQYLNVTGKNPSSFLRFPADDVTWFDACDFCNRLSRLEGLPEYYAIGSTKSKDGRIVLATVVVKGGPGYRIPTEAEFEYLARAGTTTPFPFGSVHDGTLGNVKGTEPYGTTKPGKWLGRTTTVATYPPNAFGLFDVDGNVSEWCWDLYDADYYSQFEAAPAQDPQGPETGAKRVKRGGASQYGPVHARSGRRHADVPDYASGQEGFRVVRTVEPR